MAGPGRRAIILFGDSITQQGWGAVERGWVSRIADAYQRRADVFNRGFSGYNSRQGKQMLPHLFSSPAPHSAQRPCLFTTVFFGANDAAAPHCSPCQHVPADEYEDNIAAITVAAAAVSEAVVVISPPPVDSVRWPDRSNAEVRRYTDACARAVDRARAAVAGGVAHGGKAESAAASAGGAGFGAAAGAASGAAASASVAPGRAAPPILMVNLLDLMLAGTFAPAPAHLLSRTPSSIAVAAASVGAADIAAAAAAAPTAVAEPWRAFLNDGLHLSAAGNALVFRAVMSAVAEGAPSCLPEGLPWDFPYWKDIDNTSVDTVAAAFTDSSLAITRAAAATAVASNAGPAVDVGPGADGRLPGPAPLQEVCRGRGCKTSDVCTCVE